MSRLTDATLLMSFALSTVAGPPEMLRAPLTREAVTTISLPTGCRVSGSSKVCPSVV